MDLIERLSSRLHKSDCLRICREYCDPTAMDELLSLSFSSDNRVAYNALWIMTHFSKANTPWLADKRNLLIDRVLTTDHNGITRLLLTILDKLPSAESDLRTDYLDFCLSRINSQQPYAIRALCLKQAFAQCRFYPELIEELKRESEMMSYRNLSPGLKSAKRNIDAKINRLSSQSKNIHQPHK